MYSQIIILILLIVIPIFNCMYISCVKYNENCYYQPCCEPYICYEDTTCIGMNNLTKNII